ncbi:hypothetical protein REJC140_03794 [Pseudorhizobium endolithicum]|uniref:Transposase n=1 Tax=Pseudorhizobium endolithicum TaxID=1191678 RepID=A0ABN7JRR5_9HYPH|nr:hypothetical protein REJC140_03794 [Pseudorhizobium endolithicum]
MRCYERLKIWLAENLLEWRREGTLPNFGAADRGVRIAFRTASPALLSGPAAPFVFGEAKGTKRRTNNSRGRAGRTWLRW